MKHTLLIITALMLFVGFSSGQEPIDGSTLIYKDGLFYAPDSDEPYSGEVVSHYENGQKVRKGTCKDGEVDGKWTYWYENGQKKDEGTYKDGELDGLSTGWYENGQKESEGTYKNGEKDGKWTYWYENGQKKDEGTFKGGMGSHIYSGPY